MGKKKASLKTKNVAKHLDKRIKILCERQNLHRIRSEHDVLSNRNDEDEGNKVPKNSLNHE